LASPVSVLPLTPTESAHGRWLATQAALAGYEDAARAHREHPRRCLRAQAEVLRGDVEDPSAAPTIG
jgi:hypothetical protein